MSIRKPYTTQLDDIRQLFEQFKKDVECIGELKYERIPSFFLKIKEEKRTLLL